VLHSSAGHVNCKVNARGENILEKIIVADIGATKVNVASFAIMDGNLNLTRFERYLTKESSGLLPILQNYRTLSGEESATALAVGVAGPVVKGRDAMTNLAWTINPDELRDKLGISNTFLLNDLAAFGWGISKYKGDENNKTVLQIGKITSGNRAVIAAGTGLGECTLFWNGKDHVVCASEGGHTDFGPSNEEELALLQFLFKRDRHRVSWERVVSGKYGFKNIYDFLKITGRAEEPADLAKALEGQPEIGPFLVTAALNHVPIAEKVIELFWSLYMSKAGNLSLEVLPTEGIYICGGIAEKIYPCLKKASLLDSFSNKGRMSSLLKSIPVYLITDCHLAVRGLAEYACAKLKQI
jgi:glucokinase